MSFRVRTVMREMSVPTGTSTVDFSFGVHYRTKRILFFRLCQSHRKISFRFRFSKDYRVQLAIALTVFPVLRGGQDIRDIGDRGSVHARSYCGKAARARPRMARRLLQ